MAVPAFLDEPPSEEPEPWRPPAPCPQCGQTQTRFVEMRYERSVYECELCEARFEIEE
jgi:transcription elongation factor Elf1